MFGNSWGCFWDADDSSWDARGELQRSWSDLGASWGAFGGGPSWPLLSPSSQFWLAFGPLLAALGSLLVPLGPLLATLGPLLGRSWPLLGRSWGALGRSWAPLGGLLAALGAILTTFDDPSWRRMGSKMPSEAILGRKHEFTKSIVKPKKNTHFGSQDGSRMPQDGPKIVPRGLLAALGRSWTALRPLLAALGRSWLAPSASWADLGASWGDLGPSWGDLGASWRDLRAILGAQMRITPQRGGGRAAARGAP